MNKIPTAYSSKLAITTLISVPGLWPDQLNSMEAPVSRSGNDTTEVETIPLLDTGASIEFN
jgi:hypothetical protein